MNENDLWLLAIGLFLTGYFFLRHIKYQKEKEIVTSERQELISKPIPDFVRRSMADYQAGAFFGEDQSPLAFVGYKAGKTANMAESERRKRLEVCFRIDVPACLPVKYQNWGAPATLQRYQKIHQHLHMLAGQRRGRRGYEVAVHHWDSDRGWLLSAIGETARRYGRYGYSR